MNWKITCYNGTIWKCKSQILLTEAITLFKEDTGLTELDIKKVENLH